MTEKQDVETNTRERPPESMVLHWRRLGSPTHLAQVSGLPEKTQTAGERTREPLIMHSKGALPRLRLRQTVRVGDSSTPLGWQASRLPLVRGPKYLKRPDGPLHVREPPLHTLPLALASPLFCVAAASAMSVGCCPAAAVPCVLLRALAISAETLPDCCDKHTSAGLSETWS